MAFAVAAALWAATIPLLVASAYLLVVTASSFFPRLPRVPGARLSIAVIIPAHNEAACIASTLDTVLKSEYPGELFEVWVIADNCDDDTAAIARAAGVRVVERTDPTNRGKGQALDWFIRNHAAELAGRDALVFIDADSSVDPGFLSAMSATLAHPEVRAAQGRYQVDDASTHWRTAITAAGIGGVNIVRPLGQTRLGGSVQLKGNGMALDAGLALERGWPAHSIVEDMEYSFQLLLDGVRVHFCADAIVESAMPTRQAEATMQRRRWEGGRIALARTYGPALLRRFLSTGDPVYAWALLEALVPPVSLLALWTAGVLVGAAALWSWGLLVAAAVCVVAQGAYLVAALVHIRAPWRVWLMLPAIPLFVACRIPVYVSLLLRRQTAWVRTSRPGE